MKKYGGTTAKLRRTLQGWLSAWCVVCHLGCATFTTKPMAWESEELSMMPHAGAVVPDEDGNLIAPQRPPAELSKMSLPPYRLEPPDILLINGLRLVPKAPYLLQTLDILQIIVVPTPPEAPIAGQFQVEPTGMVNLGPTYGAVKLVGLTQQEAEEAIIKQVRRQLGNPSVSVSILQISGVEQIAAEHLVTPDGTVNFGSYGSVYVAGMTLEEAQAAMEEHLAKFLDQPKLSVSVYAFNSKVYYVIREGAGIAGDAVTRIPITGNETVLDAISAVGGLDRISSRRMWISRPTFPGAGCDQILPIDWESIVMGGNPATNYQLLPGDRLFIAEDRWQALASFLDKLSNPFERVFGFGLLGGQTLQLLQRFPKGTQF